MRKLLLISLLALPGCSTSGLLTGNTQPDRWAKLYCFEGKGSVEAGSAPWAEADAHGDLVSHGLVVMGDMPDEALVELVRQGCKPQTQE